MQFFAAEVVKRRAMDTKSGLKKCILRTLGSTEVLGTSLEWFVSLVI